MYFWTYGLRRSWLDKCLKSLVSDGLWTINMVHALKTRWKLNESTFTLFIDRYERNSVAKSLS